MEGFAVDTWGEIVAIMTIIGLIYAGIRWGLRLLRESDAHRARMDQAAAVILGRDDRGGIDHRITRLEQQLYRNGGTSLADEVYRQGRQMTDIVNSQATIIREQRHQGQRLDGHIEDTQRILEQISVDRELWQETLAAQGVQTPEGPLDIDLRVLPEDDD